MEATRVAHAALQAFFTLCQRWQLDASQEQALLGRPPDLIYISWKTEKGADFLDTDTLERIGCLLGIAKALQVLLPISEADKWIRRPNEAPLFNGQTALAKMLSGDLADLVAVRRYLEAECV